MPQLPGAPPSGGTGPIQPAPLLAHSPAQAVVESEDRAQLALPPHIRQRTLRAGPQPVDSQHACPAFDRDVDRPAHPVQRQGGGASQQRGGQRRDHEPPTRQEQSLGGGLMPSLTALLPADPPRAWLAWASGRGAACPHRRTGAAPATANGTGRGLTGAAGGRPKTACHAIGVPSRWVTGTLCGLRRRTPSAPRYTVWTMVAGCPSPRSATATSPGPRGKCRRRSPVC